MPNIGFITVIAGEGANFAAYAFAPAILVTPLGALSIIFRFAQLYRHDKSSVAQYWWCCLYDFVCSAVLAHFILKERLQMLGVVGCVICLVGSVAIVIHAPLEKDIQSVKQIWYLAIQPGTYWFSHYLTSTSIHTN